MRTTRATLVLLVAAGCGSPPPPPVVGEPPVVDGPADGTAGDPTRILVTLLSRESGALSELATTHRARTCGTTGRPYVECAAALLRAAARAAGLDAETKALFEAFADTRAWTAGPDGPRALATAMESPGPASLAADALLVARGGVVLEALEVAAEEQRALLFATGLGLPCPDVMSGLARIAPARRRAALVDAGCIAAGDDTLAEAPEGLAARSALEALDGARRRVRGAGGALADALPPRFEPALRAVRIPLPLPTTLSVRGSTLTLPEVPRAIDWTPPIAILTVTGGGLHLGEPPWLGVGPHGPARLGTVLPGPLTTPEALGDDLVQVLAALPPSASGEAASGPVLVVADRAEPATRVGAVIAKLSSLADAPPIAIAVASGARQAQVAIVDTREPETAVALRLVLGARSAMVVASGIGLPADRDSASLGRRLEEVRATFPNEHAITLVLGGDVTVARLVEVLELTSQGSRRFPVVRIAVQ